MWIIFAAKSSETIAGQHVNCPTTFVNSWTFSSVHEEGHPYSHQAPGLHAQECAREHCLQHSYLGNNSNGYQ